MAQEALDFAWACGLFEGEGYVHHRPATKTGSVTRGLGLGMTDQDVVERFARIVGVGSVRPRPDRRERGWKTLWVWSAQAWGDVQPLLERMAPLMGERRRAAMVALLSDPPTRGRWQSTCRCGRPLVLLPGDTGRRCVPCRRASQRRRYAEARRG